MSWLFLRGAIYLSIALLVGGASKPTTSGDPSARPAASARQTTWPDDVDVYFKQAENAVELPTASLRTIRARPEGIARAELDMRWLVEGVGFSKRSPIFVRDNGDGTYTVVDGNSTTAVSKKQGLTQVRAIVLGPGEEPPKKPTEEERLRPLRPKLEAEIAKGRLSGTVDEQIATVKRIRAAHTEQFVPTINELERTFPDAYVIGRGRARST